MKLAAAVVAAVAAAAGGASAATEHVEQYPNPTAGRSLVLQIPGMHRMPSVSAPSGAASSASAPSTASG